MKTIIFDEKSTCWFEDAVLNEAFLKTQKNYIIDLYMIRGYVYLNDVYERLGIYWDPNNENVVWIHNGPEFLRFKYELTGDNTFTIKVGY